MYVIYLESTEEKIKISNFNPYIYINKKKEMDQILISNYKKGPSKIKLEIKIKFWKKKKRKRKCHNQEPNR